MITMKRLLLLLPLFFLIPITAQASTDPVSITELSLNPVTQDSAWVELYNADTDFKDLLQYRLQSHSRPDEKIILDKIINADGYLVISLPHDYANYADTIELWKQDQLIDTWTIEEPQAPGSSSIRLDDQIIPALLPTPGRQNIQDQKNACLEEIHEDQESSEQQSSTSQDELETGLIFINEVHANPEGDEVTEEFIELYNPGSVSINLNQWILEDASKPFIIENLAIQAQEYVTLYREQTSLGLNNSGESLTLIDPFGAVIDSMNFDHTVEGQTWNRAESYYYLATPTPGIVNNQERIEASSEPDSEDSKTENEVEVAEPELTFDENLDQIILNELLPNPEGSDTQEWIELYNPSSFSILLEGLYLKDGTSEYIFTAGELKPGEYYLLSRQESGIALNNTNETISLSIDNVITDSFSYDSSEEHISWARFADDWQETSVLTPGEKNELDEEIVDNADENTEDQEPRAQQVSTASKNSKKKQENLKRTIDLDEWNEIDDKTYVQLQGIVSVQPGILQKRVIMIQDQRGSMAIEVYFHKAEWPELQPGDLVQLYGEKSVNQTRSRLLIRDTDAITILGKQELQLPDFQEAGHLVLTQVSGILIEQSKHELLLDVNGDEVIINLKKATISASEFLEDQTIIVTGLKDGKTNAIIPRSIEDIQAQTIESQLTVVDELLMSQELIEPQSSSNVIWATAGLGSISLAGFGLTKKDLLLSWLGKLRG